MKPAIRFPAEWEPQTAVLLTWPRPQGDWGERLHAAEASIEELAAVIGGFQPILVAVPDNDTGAALTSRLQARGVPTAHIHVYTVPADDIWARDHGPITVIDSDGPMCLDFRFNGWGGKYPSTQDNALTRRLHALGAFPSSRHLGIDRILEGGAVDSDGLGTILTTARCLLHPGRNPGMKRADYEALFRDQFGATRTLWLEHGWLEGDDTDGHVDMLARFVDAQTIVYTACDRPDDPHHAPLAEMANELAAFKSARGSPYTLVPLPWPDAVHDRDGVRLPASYANFLIINNAVLVPAYGQRKDAEARAIVAAQFPQRTAISVDARTLITQGGALHCATMQLPVASGTATSPAN